MVVAHRDQTVTKLNVCVVIKAWNVMSWEMNLWGGERETCLWPNFTRPDSCLMLSVWTCVRVFLPRSPFPPSQPVPHFIALFFCQSHCQLLSTFSQLAAFSSSSACLCLQWGYRIVGRGLVTLGFTFTSLPPNLSDQMPLKDICSLYWATACLLVSTSCCPLQWYFTIL